MTDITSSIGAMKDGVYALRGMALPQLMAEGDFVSVLWLTWTGERPAANVRRVLDACLIACIDHGAEPPSARVARITASCGKQLSDAVAAGTLTLGSRHGNAASDASRWIREAVAAKQSAADVAKEAIAAGTRLAGLGHPVYERDPRVEALVQIVNEAGIPDTHFDFAHDVAEQMSALKKKTLPLNIDGALGAIFADLGASPDLADALFIVARTGGLAAHALEQAASSQSYSRG